MSSNPFDDLSNLTDETLPLVSDELTAYLEEDREKVTDVVGWWNQKKQVYPRLARMALDYHNIPGEFWLQCQVGQRVQLSFLSSFLCRCRTRVLAGPDPAFPYSQPPVSRVNTVLIMSWGMVQVGTCSYSRYCRCFKATRS